MKRKIKSKRIINPVKQRQIKIRKQKNAITVKLLKVLAGLLLLFCIYLGINSLFSYLSKCAADIGFVVNNITISGQKHVQTSQIDKIAKIKNGTPIFSISLTNLKYRLEELDWIKYVYIERNLPSSIKIFITERKPVALGQKDKKLFIIDDEGKIINEKNLTSFRDLPIFIGDGVELYANSLIKTLKTDPELYKRITSVIRISERRWNIRFDNDLEVKMPENKFESAWKTVIKLYKENQLLKPEIAKIDLRIPNKIFIEKR